MDMPKPSEAHNKLRQLVGRWSGPEKMSPSPWDPQGGTATGRVDNRLSLDGFVVVQDYEQERGGAVSFRGHGVFDWDAANSCYTLHWWDTMGMAPNVFRGNFTGDVLTMTFQGAQGHNRTIFDFTKAGHYRFQMDVSQDGKQWHNFMEGNYTKS